MGVSAAEAAAAAMEMADEDKGNNYSDVKYSSAIVPIFLSLPHLTTRVVALCKDLFRQWSNLDDSRFFVKHISGGLTNILLKVSVKEENGKEVAVTVRLYGPNTDYVVNRKRELVAIKYLSEAGFGAQLLGVFGNGMVQSFINARTLIPDDMRKPKLAAEIAKQLRRFHEIKIPGCREPQLWNDIFNFCEKSSGLQFDDVEKQIKYMTISFKEVYDEVVELKELTERLKAPVVFAHNDLLSGNLMLNEDEDKLYFIDFEYASYNYRGFGIANHFNEYPGFDCDSSLYPSQDEQYHFFRHYLQPDKPHEVSDKDLEALYNETTTFILASHLLWALWALIQAKMSAVEFDYLGYFFLRYNEYKRQKERSCSLALSYLPGSRSG